LIRRVSVRGYVLRLVDQRDVTVATSLNPDGLHAQFDQSGLVYSYDVRDRPHGGRVIHLSWRALTQFIDRARTSR
jgi:hypothetical protein